jgi:tetratricopeptide (TPR) repeat protein
MVHTPVSAFVIANGDPLLPQAIESVRPFVDEVVVLDTSAANFPECNDENGFMADFSMARNRALDRCAYSTALWFDSDDVVVGLENLQAIIAAAKDEASGREWCIIAPYEYERVGDRCVSLQARERIVSDKSKFIWRKPVHEVLLPRHGVECLNLEVPSLVWKHQRAQSVPSERNLRIMRRYVASFAAAEKSLPIQVRYDYGMELAKAGSHIEAIEHLTQYVHESNWDDARVLACLQMVQMYSFYPGRQDDARKCAEKAISIKPDWCEGHFAMAKLAYKQRDYAATVEHAERGIGCPTTQTTINVNPQDRLINIPKMLADSLSHLGRNSEAHRAYALALDATPDDPNLRTLHRITAPAFGAPAEQYHHP